MRRWLLVGSVAGVVLVGAAAVGAATATNPDMSVSSDGGAPRMTGDLPGDGPVGGSTDGPLTEPKLGDPGTRGSRQDGEPHARVVSPKPGTVAVHPISWQHHEVLAESKVRVFFYSGVEPCYVLDHVEVGHTEHKLLITLHEGSDPGAHGVACVDIAEAKAVDVTFDAPIGDRDIVDGFDV